MRNGLRVFLSLSAALLVLVLSPSALGDEAAYQLVVAPTSGLDCAGFPHETIDGTVIGCTPNTGGYPFGFFSVAADGSVAFVTEGGSIWLAKPEGSSVQLGDSASEQESPSISYDGSKVVFTGFDPATGSAGIYSVNSDGSDLQLVVSGHGVQRLRVPAISPDGSTVAYWCTPVDQRDDTSRRCGPLADGRYRNNGLMRVNIDGSNPRMVVIGPGDNTEPDGPSRLSWSPDSQWLAMDGSLTVYLGNDEYAWQQELFEYRTDGSDLFNNQDPTRQITHFKHSDDRFEKIPSFPRFSPDGSHLLYMDFVDGNGNNGNFSYLIGVDGSHPHQVFLNDDGYEHGEFIPTATPTAPPALVDEMHITVPSVHSLRVRAATSTLASVHLTVGTMSQRYSATVGEHVVASQFPLAGAVAHRTRKTGPFVSLWLSLGAAPKGARLCVVPRVKNESLWAARRAIGAANCTVGRVVYAYSRTVRKGHVLSAEPGACAHLPLSGKVALTVSKGRRG